MHSAPINLAFIGFGEAGRAFATGFATAPVVPRMMAYDIKSGSDEAPALHAAYTELGVAGMPDTAALCAGADVIVSLVTAEQAERAAETAAQSDLRGALYLDCNSCAPDTKRRSAARIEAAGGRYVDVAIMTPVHPKLHASPCLIAGPHGKAAGDVMQTLGMSASFAGDQVGAAAGRKMIRSVMVKGLEALTLECFLAARKFGIEDDVMSSLDTSYPGFDWPTRALYMIERALTHGSRRAAEMREVAQTLRDLGLEPHMTHGTVQRQDEMGALGLDAQEIGAGDLHALTGAILTATQR